jgi:hypothetical protein
MYWLNSDGHCWPSLFNQYIEVRGDCSFCWYWWNCWPSLFNQYIEVRGDCSFCWYWWNCWPSLFNQYIEVRGDCSFCWYWWNCWPSLFNQYIEVRGDCSFQITNKGISYIIITMKCQFKQWWSTIPPISTKRTITPHLYVLIKQWWLTITV